MADLAGEEIFANVFHAAKVTPRMMRLNTMPMYLQLLMLLGFLFIVILNFQNFTLLIQQT